MKGALDKAVAMGADAVQLFTQSPRAWKPPTPNPELYEAFRAQREETGMGAVICHAIYSSTSPLRTTRCTRRASQ